MRESELEKKVSSIRDSIYSNRIIDNAEYLAELGNAVVEKRPNSEWGGFLYRFNDSGLVIEYQEYAMWDKRLTVLYNGEKVFDAMDIVPQNERPLVEINVKTHSKFPKTFTVLKFIGGEWINELKELCAGARARQLESKLESKKEELERKRALKNEKKDPVISTYKESEFYRRFG